MALVECPDCGHNVSDLAPACVSCGAPIASSAAPPEVAEVALRLKRDFIGGSIGFAFGSAQWILEAQQLTPEGVFVVASVEYSSSNDLAMYQGSMRGFQQASRKITQMMLEQGWEPLPGNLGGADIVLPRFQRRARARPGSAAQARSVGSGSSAADLILKLAELRDSGVITAADFEAKKAELLERM